MSTSSFSALSSHEILQRDLIFQKSGWICKKCPSEEKFEQKFQFVSHWHKNHSRGITYEVCQWCCELFDYPSISQNVSTISTQFSNVSRYLLVSFAFKEPLFIQKECLGSMAGPEIQIIGRFWDGGQERLWRTRY